MDSRGRTLDSWLNRFVEYCSARTSPDIFKKWTGLWCLGAALERRCWIKNQGQRLFPTQYVLFVAPSGTGKSNSTSIAQDLLAETGLFRSPTSLSRASLVDALRNAERSALIINGTKSEKISYNSLYVIANELGVLIPMYDHDFMATLTDIYDGRRYEEQKRSKEIHNDIEFPQINMLAGATPSYLSTMMPEGAWEQGFISRVMMVWSDEQILKDPFADDALPESLRQKLVNDLKIITGFTGPFEFAPATRERFVKWFYAGMPPRPTHPRLSNYITRRHTHFQKLCMLYSLSRSSDQWIEDEDFELAQKTLLECEDEMQKIFPALVTGGDAKIMEEIWYQALMIFMRSKKPLGQGMVQQMLASRMSVYQTERAMQMMIKRGWFREVHVPKVGVMLEPIPKEQAN